MTKSINRRDADFSLAKSELREEITVSPVHRCEISTYSRHDLSRDPKHAISLSPSRRPKPQRQNGLTGGTGLNMNYSIIFTEISFYSETSILLQIIGIIHMTNQMKPEFDI